MKTILTVILSSSLVWAHPIATLKSVEKKYQRASGVQMDVVKKLKIQLLEKEKTSEGVIKIQPGSFKWEVTSPSKSMTLLTPSAVWVVEYPEDEKDKISVIKSRKPKKSQSPAVVAFLMGQGSLTKNFRVTPHEGHENEYSLVAKSKDESVQKMELVINKKDEVVERVKFEDAMGNLTDLEFKNVVFDKKFNDGEFKFKPPKNADINIIN